MLTLFCFLIGVEREGFLARNDNNTWLSARTEDVTLLRKGELSALIERLTAKEHLLTGDLYLVELCKL
jgi:hypothetical protein